MHKHNLSSILSKRCIAGTTQNKLNRFDGGNVNIGGVSSVQDDARYVPEANPTGASIQHVCDSKTVENAFIDFDHILGHSE